MIVPMKKIHLIVQKKDIISALENLRDLGTVHVKHQEPLTGYQLTERREEVSILTRALDILKQTKLDVEQKECSDWTECVNKVLELFAKVDHYTESIAKRKMHISQWEVWGNFNPKDMEEFVQRGIYARLCEYSTKEKPEFPQEVVLKTISTSGDLVRAIAVSREDLDLPCRIIIPPAIGLDQMRSLQEEEQGKIEDARKKIGEEVCYLKALEKSLSERKSILSFEEVEKGMREEGELALLKGFCPANVCKNIEARAKEEQWGVLIEEPLDEDEVPTLLDNPKWVNLSKPVLNIIEILPGYKEFDVSMVLLLFFILFFAMLIGDAAYGLIFMGITAFLHIKLGKKVEDKTPFHLMYVLTAATCVWGVLTGTYFGQAWLPATINPVVPWLNDFVNLQLVCFIIALIHLSIARIWSAAAKFPSIIFLSEVGWLLIVWGMFFVANMFVLGMAFPAFAKYFFIVGIPLAFFFMVEPKDFFKKIGMEFIPFLLNIISAGTDLVSYIRLFAVGLATVAVADATNAMAGTYPMGAPIILLFGHFLNLVLALMAILVHAIRLNVLEFSGQLGLEWAGVGYSPFKKMLRSKF